MTGHAIVTATVTATATTLAAVGGLHAAWGVGSSFPYPDRVTLSRVVAGTPELPGRRDSFAVAALLGAAATLVADVAPVPRPIRRIGVVVVAGVLTARGALGLAGTTSVLVPWQPDPEFVRRDRRVFGPLCLALAVGSLTSLRFRPRR
jgi:hypothetical protein